MGAWLPLPCKTLDTPHDYSGANQKDASDQTQAYSDASDLSLHTTLSSGSLDLTESSKYDIDNAVRCSRQPAGFNLEHDQVKSHEPTVLDGDEIVLEYGI